MKFIWYKSILYLLCLCLCFWTMLYLHTLMHLSSQTLYIIYGTLLVNHEENQSTVKLKAHILLNPNGRHIVGEKAIQNLQFLSLRTLHKARQDFSP